MMSPVRDGAGGALVSGLRLLGSDTPAVSRAAITEGLVQVAPPSVDLTYATLYPRWPPAFEKFWIRLKKSYKAPLWRSMTIWLAIVWSRDASPTMTLGVLQVWPKSVVFDISAGPK